MRLSICLTAAAVLGAGSTSLVAKPADPQINHTSWAFTEKGTKLRLSVDDSGNYVENTAAGKHRDHGTAVVKDGKTCFTSAMNKEGEVCWTGKDVKVGQSMLTTSDKGQKLRVMRVAYKPMSMPK